MNTAILSAKAREKLKEALDARYETRRYRTANAVVTSVTRDEFNRVISARLTIDGVSGYVVHAYGLDIGVGSQVEVENVGTPAAPDYRIVNLLPGTPTETVKIIGNSFGGYELMDLDAIRINRDGYVLIGSSADSGNRVKIDKLGLRVFTPVGEVLRVGDLSGLSDDLFGHLSGMGMYATNDPDVGGGIFLRGQLAVDGDSRIFGTLTTGARVGPGTTFGTFYDGSGNAVYGEQQRDETGAPWWTKWYKTLDREIYWAVIDPSTREKLIELHKRDPKSEWGEEGERRYFLDISASTLFGDLVAARLNVRGELSAMVGDFGTISTSILQISSDAYSSPSKTGIYAWRRSDWQNKNLPSELGMEFWKDGVRQGRWLESKGALAFGRNDDVWLNEDGLNLYASEESPDGTEERSISWYRSDTMEPVAKLFGGRWDDGETIFHTARLLVRVPDDDHPATAVLGFMSSSPPYTTLAPTFMLKHYASGDSSFDAGGFDYYYFTGARRYPIGMSGLRGRWAFSDDVLMTGPFSPPGLSKLLDEGNWGAGEDENGYITVAAYAYNAGTDEEPDIKIVRVAVDPNTGYLKVKVGTDAWKTATTS